MTHSVDDEEIRFIQSGEEYLLRTASIGRDIAAFQNSTAGRVLMGRCMETVLASITTLLEHDPRVNLAECAAAYQSAKMARDTLHWIWETVAAGDLAEQHIISEMPDITLEEVLNRE